MVVYCANKNIDVSLIPSLGGIEGEGEREGGERGREEERGGRDRERERGRGDK